jgi:hypothetical protein
MYPASELLIRKDHLEEPIVVNFKEMEWSCWAIFAAFAEFPRATMWHCSIFM